MTGTTIAQMIPLVISPALTRLYTPQDFGMFALFSSLATVTAVFATGRYELAVMLPEKDEDAVNVVALSFTLSITVSSVILLFVWIFNRPVSVLLGNPALSKWLYFVPLMIVLSSFYLTLMYWSNRKQHYKRIALSDISLKAGSEGLKFGMGLTKTLTNGLVVGSIAGQAIATGVLSCQIAREDGEKFRFVRLRKMLSHLMAYRRFPMYTLPYSLIGSFSNEFIIFALTSFHYLHIAGFLGFTRRIVVAPINFVAASLGRVFFQEASVSIGTPQFEQLTMNLMTSITEILTPPFIFFAFWAPEIFKFAFGNAWTEAGRYASILTPAIFCLLYTSWPERIYEITQKQHISFAIQFCSDALRISLMWGMFSAGIKPFFCVLAYSLASCLYNGAYLFGIFKIARFKLTGLSFLARRIVFLAAVFCSTTFIITRSMPTELLQFLFGAIAVFSYSAYRIITYIRVKRTV